MRNKVVAFARNDVSLIHCTQVSKSGAAKYVSELFSAMRERVPYARLVCPTDFEHRNAYPAESLVYFAELEGKGRGQKLRSMIRQIFDSTQKILELKANSSHVVVHFNFPGLIFFALPQFLYLKRRGLLLVLTVHDVIPHRWLLPGLMNGIERWVLKKLYESADALVVHHESQRKTLVSEFGIPAEHVSVVHHGVFSLSDAPLEYPSGDEFVALCFGSIRENKGVYLSIQAVQSLRAEGVPVRLLIAGGVSQGETGYWEKCKELIARAPNGIDVVNGYIPESEIRQYFERSHFVLLPYSDFFSQSGVATMALSSGRAIVSTEVGGLGELINSGRFGVKIDGASAAAVAAAIRQAVVIGHEGLCAMGEDAYKHFFENYSWVRVAELQCGIYADVLNSMG